jgi:putative hydrolase of HD superfamily
LNTERLERQIAFILEIDRLKSILRRSYLLSDPRHENSAEHSWHLAVMAMVLAEHANSEVNPLRVLQMLLVHDIVEIDSGDTYIYDAAGNDTKAERENAAARRIFGLLPPDQETEIAQLWQEFEARETPEAKFAAALDRLMPLLHNYHTEGRSWREHGITEGQVMSLNSHMNEGSQTLWEYAEALIKDATTKGDLREENEKGNGNAARNAEHRVV